MNGIARPECLAPAGDRAALERAAAAGADAVYLGCSAFSARAGAANFSEEELRSAIAFAHLHHMRVHVTVNTLVKDDELADVSAVLGLLSEVRADAVLIQDLGVLSLARACFPDLAVHASTQMAIHNAAGVRWCARQGITRAVLARECSLSEIALASKEEIETETFVHGAQCVSVSGECLFSSMIGGRSGNRGRCAQPCRMQYVYRGKKGAWLSPRDVCLRNDLPALAAAGVSSLKIEGRLKRPEYVAVTTGSYSRALHSLAEGRFLPADAEETRDLAQIFQRGGFFRGCAFGCEDAGVIDPTRVNHAGVPVGVIERMKNGFACVRLSLDLHDGDSLRFLTSAGDAETVYSGKEEAAGGTALVRLREGLVVKPGDRVVRLADAAQLAAAMAMPIPPIPCDMTLRAVPGEPLRLSVTDGESTAEAEGDTVQAASTRSLTQEDAAKNLSKTGGTPFVMKGLVLQGSGAFVPVSALNALRREALEKLAALRADAFGGPARRRLPAPTCVLPAGKLPETVIFRSPAQLAGGLPESVRPVWFPEDFREDALEAGLKDLPEGTWLQLPVVCEEATLEMLRAFAHRHRDVLGGVVLGSVGQLGIPWDLPYGTGMGVPVMNRRAAAFLLAQGCAFVTASPELTAGETEALCAGGVPAYVPAYGRLQLMLLHHCPARTRLNLRTGRAACTMCDLGAPDALAGTVLTDRMGCAFPLQRIRLPEGCAVRLLNERPTDLLQAAAGFARLTELTDETPDEAAAVLREMRGGLPIDRPTTTGHWRRPVE